MKVAAKAFALCIDNTGYGASLILAKVYRIISDPTAAKDDLVRIVDESGEDYLHPKNYFVFVDFPSAVGKKILALETRTVRFTLDPKRPPRLTKKAKARLARLADKDIDLTDLPATYGVAWKRG